MTGGRCNDTFVFPRGWTNPGDHLDVWTAAVWIFIKSLAEWLVLIECYSHLLFWWRRFTSKWKSTSWLAWIKSRIKSRPHSRWMISSLRLFTWGHGLVQRNRLVSISLQTASFSSASDMCEILRITHNPLFPLALALCLLPRSSGRVLLCDEKSSSLKTIDGSEEEWNFYSGGVQYSPLWPADTDLGSVVFLSVLFAWEGFPFPLYL